MWQGEWRLMGGGCDGGRGGRVCGGVAVAADDEEQSWAISPLKNQADQGDQAPSLLGTGRVLLWLWLLLLLLLWLHFAAATWARSHAHSHNPVPYARARVRLSRPHAWPGVCSTAWRNCVCVYVCV